MGIRGWEFYLPLTEIENVIATHNMSMKTLTFTARSATNPGRMVTFTIVDDRVHVDFGGALLESVEKGVFPEHEDDTRGPVNQEGEFLPEWVRPAGMFILQHGFDSFPLSDIDARTNDGYLSVVIWARATGLRLAPLVLKWMEVDNPSGAIAFVDELNRRKNSSLDEKKKPGFLDYWLTYILGGAFFIMLLGKAFSSKKDNDED